MTECFGRARSRYDSCLGGGAHNTPHGGHTMIWTLALVLFVLWLLGGFVFHVGGGLIHLLLVIAVVVVLYRVITGRRPIA